MCTVPQQERSGADEMHFADLEVNESANQLGGGCERLQLDTRPLLLQKFLVLPHCLGTYQM